MASRICPTNRPDAPTPDAVAMGAEPLLVVGATAAAADKEEKPDSEAMTPRLY